jgi:hypothetical protein
VTSALAQSSEAEVQFARGEILFSVSQKDGALRRDHSAGFDMAPFSLSVIVARFALDSGLALRYTYSMLID